jgi:hypothetical protein
MIYWINEKLVKQSLKSPLELQTYELLLTQLDEFLAAKLPKTVYEDAVFYGYDSEEYDQLNFN